MEVRMEHTEGHGRQAEVWVDGHPLIVRDGVSSPGGRVSPGVLGPVRFTYTRDEAMDWAQAVRDNPGHRKLLEPVRGWAYVGYGQIVGIMPLVIDFGLLRMQDGHWTNDNDLIGRYVRIPIDRLEIGGAGP